MRERKVEEDIVRECSLKYSNKKKIVIRGDSTMVRVFSFDPKRPAFESWYRKKMFLFFFFSNISGLLNSIWKFPQMSLCPRFIQLTISRVKFTLYIFSVYVRGKTLASVTEDLGVFWLELHRETETLLIEKYSVIYLSVMYIKNSSFFKLKNQWNMNEMSVKFHWFFWVFFI